MKKIINLTIRNIKVYFSDKGMFFTSLITPAILLILYSTFLANVYKDAFISAIPDGIQISNKLLNGLVSGQLVGSLLSVSCITVAFCSNMLMVQDKVNGNLKDLIITPTDKKTLAISYFLASFISTLIVNLFALGLCLIYIAINGWFMNTNDILLIVLNVISLTLFGCILSSLINSFLSTQGQISAVGSIVSSMYGFIAGAYMPMSQFGAGLRNQYGTIPENAKQFTQYMMSRMQTNDYMGVLPEVGSTMYVLYHVSGGEISNIAANTLTNIIYNNYSVAGNCNDTQDNLKKNNLRKSFRVTNTTPSYGGKDEPSEEEIKYMIKYNTASQNRCVTLHDYKSKINQLPAKFGCPFRIGVIEENNKVVIYALGLNAEGKLDNKLSETVANNIIEYLSHYKMLNDFIEMRSGKIINVSFRVTLYADKSYDKAAVAKKVIDEIYDYMDIRKHEMGEDIFLGDLQKNISQIDGVINISQFQAYNKTGEGYSEDTITQELVTADNRCYYSNGDYVEDTDNMQIDLNASDMILYSEANSLFEIKDKAKDITVVVKTR